MSDEGNSKGRGGIDSTVTGGSSGGDSGFVVRDRRRFESDGSERKEVEAEGTQAASAVGTSVSGSTIRVGSEEHGKSASPDIAEDRHSFTGEVAAGKVAAGKVAAGQGTSVGQGLEHQHHTEKKADGMQDSDTGQGSPSGGVTGFEDVSFSSFVMSLATQALMQLGVVAPPEGYELPQDIHGAKQSIDILQMLQDKTKGNLDAQEAALLEDVLHNVRLAFVRRR